MENARFKSRPSADMFHPLGIISTARPLVNLIFGIVTTSPRPVWQRTRRFHDYTKIYPDRTTKSSLRSKEAYHGYAYQHCITSLNKIFQQYPHKTTINLAKRFLPYCDNT